MAANTNQRCSYFLCTQQSFFPLIWYILSWWLQSKINRQHAIAKAGTWLKQEQGWNCQTQQDLPISILRGLNKKGLSDHDCATCKKRSEEYRIQQFRRWSSLKCIHMQKMLLPGSENKTPVYILVGDTWCTDHQSFDSACFNGTALVEPNTRSSHWLRWH